MKNEQVNSDYQTKLIAQRRDESGFALVAALIILILLGVISATVLAFSTSETRTASNEIKRTEAFYAAEAKLEEMTNRFNDLFQDSVDPTSDLLSDIANTNSPTLDAALVTGRGYSFAGSTLALDTVKINQLTAIFGNTKPFIRIPDGAYSGMSATVTPYFGIATATDTYSGTTVQVRRNFNSYLLPVFQFSLFSDGDIELDPGKPMYISGRVHANKNVYALRNLLFTGNITAAGELVTDVNRGGGLNNKTDYIGVNMMVSSSGSGCSPGDICKVPFTDGTNRLGSVIGGPNFNSTAPLPGEPDPRGYHPGSPGPIQFPTTAPRGTIWDDNSVLPPVRVGSSGNNGTPGQFNKQILTASSAGLAIEPLTLPLGLDDVRPVELIKRNLPGTDTTLIKQARYHNKAQIRILIDDENIPGTNVAGIPIPAGSETSVNGNGVNLSTFNPIPLCSAPCTLRRITDSGAYEVTDMRPMQKGAGAISDAFAQTVRGIKGAVEIVSGSPGYVIPAGAGINGHILIQVVDKNGVIYDVTKDILSMGMTVGEPNAIVQLQRPLWAAFMQDSFDRLRRNDRATLYDIQQETDTIAGTGSAGWERDGEIKLLRRSDLDDLGFINQPLSTLQEDLGPRPIRDAVPHVMPNITQLATGADFNAIVPINVYNVREGWISNRQEERYVYKRGVTSVVDINMHNLARWLDGKFDGNLLAGRTARSSNIGSTNSGYILYVSDRRGDQPKSETPNTTIGGSAITTTNGDVDNENVYFDPTQTIAAAPKVANGSVPNKGEDVIIDSIFQGKDNKMQKDETELPDSSIYPARFPETTTGATWEFSAPTTPATPFEDRLSRAIGVLSWHNDVQLGEDYFRRSVRLSYGENLTTTCAYGGTTGGVPDVAIWNCDNTVGNPKLSQTKGISIASENMVYIAGNYNTTGVGSFAVGGSNLNTGKLTDYLGPQVPASIVCDAFFPLSKTWFDASAAMYPEGSAGGRVAASPYYRGADSLAIFDKEATAVRAAVMFGSTLSALNVSGTTPARNSAGLISSGGMHSAPRFLEFWNLGGTNELHWSFSGSMVTLFNSTQAFAPWESIVIYTPPVRNWSYDTTFSNPNRLPPGTPFFQYVQSSGFQQIIDR